MSWSYYEGACGPTEWSKQWPIAAGKNQSPINIDVDRINANNISINKEIVFKYNPFDLTILRNTGKTWQVRDDGDKNEISGGPLKNTYRLVQIHAHWGSNDNEGSEHTIDGRQYSGELHLVHYNTKYSDFEQATKHTDGLCVLGVLFKLGKYHPELAKISTKIKNVVHEGETCPIKPLNANKLLPDRLSYWTYHGSLTTPPFNESVTWILFSEPIELSHEQLEDFRKLRDHPKDACTDDCECENRILFNYRPVVPLCDRSVFYVVCANYLGNSTHNAQCPACSPTSC